MMPRMPVTTLALDGDDTLWHSETLYEVTTHQFAELLAPWLGSRNADDELLATERRNLRLFGYGVKGYMLSMIETAIEVSDGRVTAREIQQVIDWGKGMLAHPVELLDGVRDTIDELADDYRLLLVTKGDLFHQETKVAGSGLAERFWRVEIVGEKDEATYGRILAQYGIPPEEFVMVGNSVRSDVVPVLALGGRAVHVPHRLTWALEAAEPPAEHDGYWTIERFADLPALLRTLDAGSGED
jgi:putative hydrolase of the HAD superfamily